MAGEARIIFEKLKLYKTGKRISYKRYQKELAKLQKGLPPYN